VTGKDYKGNHQGCVYGWKEGAAHQFFGPTNAVAVWSIKKLSPQHRVQLRAPGGCCRVDRPAATVSARWKRNTCERRDPRTGYRLAAASQATGRFRNGHGGARPRRPERYPRRRGAVQAAVLGGAPRGLALTALPRAAGAWPATPPPNAVRLSHPSSPAGAGWQTERRANRRAFAGFGGRNGLAWVPSLR
jgi:hypothetical protein